MLGDITKLLHFTGGRATQVLQEQSNTTEVYYDYVQTLPEKNREGNINHFPAVHINNNNNNRENTTRILQKQSTSTTKPH